MKNRIDLSAIEVSAFLEMLGVKQVHIGGERECRFSCPFDHPFGDTRPSAYMNTETTAFVCFSCGQRGNAITFLAKLRDVSYATAARWIAEKWAPEGIHIDDMEAWLLRTFAESQQDEVEPAPQVLDERHLDERRVDWYTTAHHACQYLLARGLLPGALQEHEFGYDSISDRPFLTVRDEEGRLVGFKGRAWHQRQEPKYLVLGDSERSIAAYGERYGFHPYDASRYVYGLHSARLVDGRLILVEGEFNAVMMRQMGHENAVAPSGSTLSQRQVQLVVEYADEVVLLFDSDPSNDASRSLAAIKVLKAVDAFEPYVRVRVCEEHEGDPMEMSADEVGRLVDGAIPSTTFRISNLFV